MLIETNEVFTITQANHLFSPVANVAHKKGKAIIIKHGKPCLLVVSLVGLSEEEISALENIISHKTAVSECKSE